jgi:epoxyqueuosine reductase QueG
MGLLMTPRLGPRVRIGVITTDLPLPESRQQERPDMIEFCRICKKCADVCPSRAIPRDERREIEGVKRWQINQEACYTYWCITGTDCGKCMSDCPYSHKDNFLHNMVRFMIRRSSLFRRIAVKLDDVFYGRKPKPKPFPKWLKNQKSEREIRNQY